MPFGYPAEKPTPSSSASVESITGKLSSYLKTKDDSSKFDALKSDGAAASSKNAVSTSIRDTTDKIGSWFGVSKPDSEPDIEAQGNSSLLGRFSGRQSGGAASSSSTPADRKNLTGINKIKAAVGMEVKEPTALDKMEESCNSCGLTYKQRLAAFACCLAGGILMFALSAYTVPAILIGQGHKFVLFFCMANFCVCGSTGFLVGPIKQLKTMCAPTRAIAAAVYALCLGLTIYAAVKGKAGPALLFMIIMVLSFIWYALSYIPFARSMVTKFLKTVISS